jgi:Phasin protein
MIPLTWIADLNAKLQSYAEQHLAAALEFAHKLSLAKDFHDLARIQAEFFQNRMQSLGEQTKDITEACTNSAAVRSRALSGWCRPDSPFARDASNKLVRRSYWLDMNDRTLVMVMVNGIGAHLTNDEKRAHLIDLKRGHLIDQACVQEILSPEK